ncbi:unnamed protein product, partial [marine sediment metagenome]
NDGHGNSPFLPCGKIAPESVKGHYRYSECDNNKHETIEDNTRAVQKTCGD